MRSNNPSDPTATTGLISQEVLKKKYILFTKHASFKPTSISKIKNQQKAFWKKQKEVYARKSRVIEKNFLFETWLN